MSESMSDSMSESMRDENTIIDEMKFESVSQCRPSVLSRLAGELTALVAERDAPNFILTIRLRNDEGLEHIEKAIDHIKALWKYKPSSRTTYPLRNDDQEVIGSWAWGMVSSVTMFNTIRTNTLLSIENLSVSIGDKLILRDVNVKIDDLVRTDSTEITGQVVAFLGPSGFGKTTLLRVLAGLPQPSSSHKVTGNVFIGVERAPAQAGKVGMVSQQYELFRHRTVLGNLELAASMAINHPSGKEAKDRSMEILNLFELGDHADSYPVELSGGQRQRVAIAQQILCSDHFLLMDEPTAGLDPVIKKRVCATISRVANRSELSTVLLVTHDIAAAVAIADTIILLGKERASDGSVIPGARVITSYDLVARELCWQPDVRHMPAYRETVEEIQDRFETL